MDEKNILSDLVKFITKVEQVIKTQDSFSKEYVTNKDLQKIVQGFVKQTELFAEWMNKSKKTTETLVSKEFDKLVVMLNETSKRLTKIVSDKGLTVDVKFEALKGELQGYVDTIKTSTLWDIEWLKEQMKAKLEQKDIEWLIAKSNETIIDDEKQWKDKTYSSNKIEELVSKKIKDIPQRRDAAWWSPVFIKDANRDWGFANVLKFANATVDIVNNETVITTTWWDVVWPASATDGNIALYDWATGKLIKNSTYSPASFAPALTSDENYVTDAQLIVIDNTSGTNTGDQDLSWLVVKNVAITWAAKTKITYDAKWLVTAWADATTADIADSSNKRYVTDANLTVIGNTSWTNTWDQDLSWLLPKAWWTMSGDIILWENTSLQLDWVLSADGKWSWTTITATAWYTQAFWDLVTLDKDDSRREAVDISVAAAATWDARGLLWMVVSAWTDGTACTILLQGTIRADANFPALTIWAPVYASTTWDIVVTQPVTTDYVIRIIWSALTADSMYFNPWTSRTTHT